MKAEDSSGAHGSGSWPSSAANAGRPLNGVKVLDASRVLAGPFCAMLLADLGADVVKVEPPGGDETRRWGPPFIGESAAYYFVANRNKWDVSLDLKDPADARIMRELVRQADILIHNYTHDRALDFRLDLPSVREINQDIIYVAISGFADNESSRRGYDLLAQALGGLMSVTGTADGPPTKVGVPISDIAAGLFAALGATAALAGRRLTSSGLTVDVSLYDTTLTLLTNQAMSYFASQQIPQRQGNDHPNVAPYGLFATGDGNIILAAASDQQFAALCGVLGCPELADDERFRDNRHRVAGRKALRREIEKRLATRSAHGWSVEFDLSGVPNGVVRSVPEALTAPESRSVSHADHAEGGPVPQVLSPIRINGDYLAPYLAPPDHGEHNGLFHRSAD